MSKYLFNVIDLKTNKLSISFTKTLKQIINSEFDDLGLDEFVKYQSVTLTDALFFEDNLIVITRIM